MKFSRKNLGRAASAFLATAMLAALSAMPASAIGANGIQGAGDDKAIHNLTFDSVLWLPENTSVPDATFTYKLNEVDSVTSETVPNYSGIQVKASTDTIIAGDGYLKGEAEFGASISSSKVENKTGINKATVSVSIPLNELSFDNVGVYKYTLTQELTSDSTADFNLTKITNRVVYLYVADVSTNSTPDYEVTGAVLVDKESYDSAAKSDGTITNYYLLTGDPDNPDTDPPVVKNNTLKISNAIEGAMGDMTETFQFSFTIKNSDASKKYTYKIFDKNGSEKASNGGTASVNTAVSNIALGDGEYIMVYGLSASDTFDVAQTDANRDGYTTAITDQTGTSVSNMSLATATELAFTNTRDAITPTGVVMNVAPYLLLVVVAAAAGFVFLRKRRED